MSDLSEYDIDYIEIIGYVGGVVLAVALVPQVIKSCVEQSTEDFSYGWQIIYIVGLWLNFIYFIMINAVPAWVTLIFEMLFAHFLLFLKLRLDGCSRKIKDDSGGEAIMLDTKSTFRGEEEVVEDGFLQNPSDIINRTCNLTKELTVGHSVSFSTSSMDKSELVAKAYRGFHFTIDVRFNVPIAPDFGNDVMNEMLSAAKRHGIRSVGNMLEIFNGSQSPPGFASAVLLDESHMTTHCYSDEGMLAFDCFTCGSNPEGTRRVTEDVARFFKERLGEKTIKIEVGHMPRFPENEKKI